MATIERAVPQNIEAEEAVLGSILIDDSALYKVGSFLRPEHFYVEKNGWIFQAFLTVSERREPIDVLTACDELERQGQLQEAGGAAYVTSLLNAVPTAVHVEHYARLVERTAVLRQLIAAAGEIARIAYDATGDADEVLDQAEHVIFDIAQKRVSRDFMPLSQILASYLEQLDQIKEGVTTLGLSTGFADLDKLTGGLQRGDLIILAARPSVGKTALALNIAHHIAVKEHAPVAIFSLEMSKEQLAHRLLSAEATIDSQRLRMGDYNEDELRRISRAFGVLSEAPVYVDDTPGIGTIELRSKARRLYLERGIRLVIVDYLQLMRGRRTENRVQEISDISRSLKELARELEVPVIALSQLSRAPEQRTEHRPILSDLRESGSLEQDADMVIFIYREELYDSETEKKGIADIILGKHRNGPTGEFGLYFFKETTRFANLAIHEEPQ
jgi:replicative DNA helicase